jgi:uncharacterized protein YpbB
MPEGAAAQRLGAEQLSFITDTLLSTFHWPRFVTQLQDHHAGHAHRQIPGKSTAVQLSKKWLDSALAQQEIAKKFSQQLETLLPAAESDGYQQLLQRTTAAVDYFSREIRGQILEPLQEHIAEIRASKKAKKYLQELKTLQLVCTRKHQQVTDALKIVSGLQKGIDTTQLLSDIQEDRLNQQQQQQEEIDNKPPGKPQKGDTNRTSLRLYREGISIAEIASRRGLSLSTIEGHLASFIPTGEIDVKELVPDDKIQAILSAIRSVGGSSLGPIKSRLGEGYSFGEIRAVMTWSRSSAPTSNPSPSST